MNIERRLNRQLRKARLPKQSPKESGYSQNRFISIVASIAVVFAIGYHTLAQSFSGYLGSGSSGSGCSSSTLAASTPSLGGRGQAKVLGTILRGGLLAAHQSLPANLSQALEWGQDTAWMATVLGSISQVADPADGDWRVIDEVFPFAGSAKTNPHSFVYEFQVKVRYTLTPGSSVYIGGRCYRNKTGVQETSEKTFGILLHTDEILELKVSPGVGNDAQAQVLNYELAGFRTCGGGNRDRACGEYGMRLSSHGVNVALDFGLASPVSRRAGIKGTLRLVSDTPDAPLAHPAMLCYASQPNSDVVVLRDPDWDGAIRQIKGADGLLDVRLDDDRGYSLLHFPPDAVGVQGPDGLYQTIGQPFASWSLRTGSDDDPTNTGIVEVEQQIGELAMQNGGVTHRYTWVPEDEGWDLLRGDGLAGDRERVRWNDAKTVKEVIREQYDPATGRIDRLNVTVYEKLVDGEDVLFKTREIANPGPNEKVTTYSYGRIPGQVGYGQLTQVVDPNGGWIRYAYDEEDRVVTLWQGFLNQRQTDDLEKCRVRTYDYQALRGSRDDGSQPRIARTEIMSLLGKELGRTYRVIRGESSWTYRASEAGAVWKAKENVVVRQERYAEGEFADHLKSVLDPLGRLTTFAYELDGDRLITTERSGVANRAQDTVKKGIETVRINGRDGALYSIQRTDIETGIRVEQVRYGDHDRIGRAQRIDYADGSYELVTRGDCCGVDFERKRDGRQISYLRDPLGRVILKVTGDQEEHYMYDSAGDVVEWTLSDTSGRSQSQVRRQKRNLAGDIVESDDGHGQRSYRILNQRPQMTEMARAVADSRMTEDILPGYQEEETSPGGATIIRTYAADGSLLSLTGTAVHPVRYDYGVDQDQDQWRAYTKTVHLNPDGTDTAEWIAVYQDALERNYRTLYVDGSEERQFFNPAGELIKNVDADGVTTLYERDLLGDETTTAIDMNRNGKIDYKGEDIINRSVREYVVHAGKEATRVERWVWNDEKKDRSTLRSANIASADGMDVWQIRWVEGNREVVTHVQRRMDEDGRETEITTQPDGSRNEAIRDEGKLVSRARLDASGNPVSNTEYAYNALDQLVSVTDARAGTTEYEYDEYGNRVLAKSPTPKSGEDRPVTRYRYDEDNQIIQTIHPDGGSVFIDYWPTGEKRSVRGVRTYPVYYDYDYAGRLRQLTTWQDASAQQGQAQTQWVRDNRGRVTQKLYADGRGPSYTYTAAGRLESRTWARGVVTDYRYDAAGRLEKTTYSDDTEKVERKYTRDGQLEEIKQGKAKTELTYNAWGQLTKEKRKGSNDHEIKREYDELGRPAGYELKQGGEKARARYAYDSAGRLAEVGNEDLMARYEYLPMGHQVATLTLSDKHGTERMRSTKEYDALNRLTSIGHRTPKGVMASFDYTYNLANQRTEMHREDGSYWRYQYDDLGQVIFGGEYGPHGQPLPGHGFGYEFDDIGNRQHSTKLAVPFDGAEEANVGLRSDYRANLLNQYELRTIASRAEILGQTDSRASLQAQAENAQGEVLPTTVERENSHFRVTAPVNNRQREATTSIEVEASLNGNQSTQSTTVITPGTPVTYAYDADGNLLQDESWHYEWNGENRLVEMYSRQTVAPAKRQRLDFVYDAYGRRVEKVISGWDDKKADYKESRHIGYVYDGRNLVGEFQEHGKVTQWKTYLWGLDLSHGRQGAGGIGGLLAISTLGEEGKASKKEDPEVLLPFYDGNGNVMGLVLAESAEAVALYAYGVFGELLRASGPDADGNAFRFSTKYADVETGLCYYGYRCYAPQTGRWLNRDPIEEEGGLNMQGFVFNDPVNLWDRDGRIVPAVVCVIIAGATLCGCGGPPPLTPSQIKQRTREFFASLAGGDSWDEACRDCTFVSTVPQRRAPNPAHWVADCILCAAKKCASKSTLVAANSCFKKKSVNCHLGIAP